MQLESLETTDEWNHDDESHRKSWIRKHKDGEIDERTTMYGERHAHRRRREYQGILDHVRNAERLRDD